MNLNKNCRSDEEEQGAEMKQHFHILAVDDSHIDRKLLERLLTISSYQVTCLESGDKALEYLGLHLDDKNTKNIPKQEIDEFGTSDSSPSSSLVISQEQVSKVVVNMIMTDYSMPGISGYDLLKRVKDSSWKDIPVVVMSSEDIPSRINMCLESGAKEFLLKPVKLSDLSKLESHLQMKSGVCTNKSSCDEEMTSSNEDDMTNSTTKYNKSSILNSNKRKLQVVTTPKLDMLPRVTELPVS